MSSVAAIGETAGQVWEYLKQNGNSSVSALKLGVRAPKSLLDMALGWLAREGKIEFEQEKRIVRVRLKNG